MLEQWFDKFMSELDVWLIIGMIGQAAFGSRFIIQWWASEKEKKSVIPLPFWYLSIIGTTLNLFYGIIKAQPFIIFAYSLNNFIYVRNLILIKNQKKREAAEMQPDAEPSEVTVSA